MKRVFKGMRLLIVFAVCAVVVLMMAVVALVRPWQKSIEERALAMFGNDSSEISEYTIERYLEFFSDVGEKSLSEYPGNRAFRLTWIGGYGGTFLACARLDLSDEGRPFLIYKEWWWRKMGPPEVFVGTSTIPAESIHVLDSLLNEFGFWEWTKETESGSFGMNQVFLLEAREGGRRHLMQRQVGPDGFGDIIDWFMSWSDEARKNARTGSE